MKKIIYLIYFISVCMAIALLPSCKKLIEIPDNVPGNLVTAQVFADSTTAISGVSGIYYNAFSSAGSLVTYTSLYPSLSADDLTSPTATNQDFYTNTLFAGSASATASVSPIWNGFYGSTMIYQANAAIDGLQASTTLSTTLKNQLIGECEVVRALCYFDLVNLFGPVPLAVTSSYQVNSTLPRAPVDSVYAQIKRDLSDAIKRLPVTYPSAGKARPNKYTAMALLSRVYLYQQQWSNALATANTIINSGIYNLEPVLDNVFIINNNNNKEVLWQGVDGGSFTYVAPDATNFLPTSLTSTPRYALTSYLVNAFEAGDQRKVSWVGSFTVGSVTYYYPNKYKNANNKQVGTRVEGNVMFRLAEQYLIAAEASAQLGDNQSAFNALLVLRKRAFGVPAPPNPPGNVTAASSQSQMLTAIAHERQVELFTEQGHRWFDLKRTGTVNSVLSLEKSTWPSDGHSALYPVPFDQLNLNLGWQQNPGY